MPPSPEIRSTPKSHEPSRRLYENAVANGEQYRMASIEVDTVIDSAQQMFLAGKIEPQEVYSALVDFRDTTLSNIQHKGPCRKGHNMTDLNRLVTGADFIVERFLAPFVYSLDSNHIDHLRSFVADGSSGKAAESLGILLDSKYEAVWRNAPQEYINNIRGAIHENTALALLNTQESATAVALPANTADDILRRTDLDYYLYDHTKATGYKLGVSIKSSFEAKRSEKQQYPNDIVVCAADFDNRDFAISRLLVRKFAGSPGLSGEEKQRLWAAYCSIRQTIHDQLVNVKSDALVLPQSFDKTKLLTLAA